MIKYLKHIKGSLLNGLFISIILFASASIFDKELAGKHERFSQTYSSSEVVDNKSDAVHTDTFSYHRYFNLFTKKPVDCRIKLTEKNLLFVANTKTITAYKLGFKTHLDLKPIIYTGSKIPIGPYYPCTEPPSVS